MKIGHKNKIAILDTGASISLINRKHIGENFTILPPVNLDIQVANGELLKSSGTCKIVVKIACKKFLIQFQIIDNLPYDIIVGSDFLDGKAKIDMIKGVLKLKVDHDFSNFPIRNVSRKSDSMVTAPLRVFKKPIEPTQVYLDSDVIIPANSEITFPVPVNIVENIEKQLLFQPKEHKGKIYTARTLLSTGSIISVNLINLSDKSVKLYKNANLGELQAVEEVIDAKFQDLPETFTDRSEFEKKVNIDAAHLSATDRQRVMDMLWRNHEAFAFNPKKPRPTNFTEHTIDTGNAKPINMPPHRQNPKVEEISHGLVDQMLGNRIVQNSHSPWAAPVVLAKKADGSWRFCVDYRRLNSVTKREIYPIPRIDDTLNSLSGNIYFSALDCASGYWQIKIAKCDRAKTAFITKRGLYEFKVMPFGLTNAPATWQRTMDLVLAGLKWHICLVYLDDIIVFSKTVDEHLTNLQLVFDALLKHRISLRLDKCYFFQSKVKYLGYIVSKDGISIDCDKIKSIIDFKPPHDIHGVRRFLGLCNVYRKFIPDYAMLTAPITQLTRKNSKFVWSDTCQSIFAQLKDHLTQAPILIFPNFQQQFVLTTDASNDGISAILSQVTNGQEQVIEYASRPFKSAELNYCATAKECLGLIWGIHHFRSYLLHTKFLAHTDHQALEYVKTYKDLNSRMGRWYMTLQEYDFDVKHKPGKLIPHADALSRSVLLIGTSQTPIINASLIPHEGFGKVLSIEGLPPTVNNILPEIEEFKKEQQKDSSLNMYKVYADTKTEQKRQRFYYDKYLLFRDWIDNVRTKSTIKQLIVPTTLREIIVKQFHEELMGGHFGSDKTLAALKMRFWWPGMNEDVAYWIRTCQDCESRKTPKYVRKAGLLQPIPVASRPFERIGMDFMGRLKTTTNGNSYILVIVDYLSKWGEAFATSDQQAETVAKIFVEKIVCKFGIPKNVVSDRAKDFIGDVMTSVYKLLNIHKAPATADHQQTDGQAENLNKTFIDQLSHHVSSSNRDWDLFLPYVVMQYNTKVHSSTKFSPYNLLFGHEMHLPIDVALDLMKTDPVTNYASYAKTLVTRLFNSHQLATTNIQHAQQIQANAYNQRHFDIEYEIGDIVRMFKPRKPKKTSDPQINKKFDHLWRGPYEIVEKVSKLLYRLKEPISGTVLKDLTNVQFLKKAEYYDQLPSVLKTQQQPVTSNTQSSVTVPQQEATVSVPQTVARDISGSNSDSSHSTEQIATNTVPDNCDSDHTASEITMDSAPAPLKGISEDSPLNDIAAVLDTRIHRKSKHSKAHRQYLVRYKPHLNLPDKWLNHHFIPKALRKMHVLVVRTSGKRTWGRRKNEVHTMWLPKGSKASVAQVPQKHPKLLKPPHQIWVPMVSPDLVVSSSASRR